MEGGNDGTPLLQRFMMASCLPFKSQEGKETLGALHTASPGGSPSKAAQMAPFPSPASWILKGHPPLRPRGCWQKKQQAAVWPHLVRHLLFSGTPPPRRRLLPLLVGNSKTSWVLLFPTPPRISVDMGLATMNFTGTIICYRTSF